MPQDRIQPFVYRGRQRGFGIRDAIKYGKQAMRMKKEYDKAKADAGKKYEKSRKTRSDKGTKRRAKATGYKTRNVTNGIHTYSKLAPRSYKAKEMERKFPQVLSQTYYITSPESYSDLNPGVDGTLTNADMLYSVPSVEWTNSSIHLFNVHNTEAHWFPNPQGQQTNRGYRTGTQLTNIPDDTQLGTVSTSSNDSFIFVNDPTNVRLTSLQCPFKQNGLAENALGAFAGGSTNWTIPNSSLEAIYINLKVGNPTIQDEYITLKVIRLNDGDTTLEPGTLGVDNAQRTALTQTICNSGKFTNPQQFSTIYSMRIRIPGIKTGNKLQQRTIRKKLSLHYLRSNYRKQYNANNLSSIGLDAQPSYVLSDDDTFFNGVFIVLQSNCIDDQYIADINIEKGDTTIPQYYERVPQVATYPPVGIPSNVEGGKYKKIAGGAQHTVSGSITCIHRVQSKRRAIGDATNTALNNLQEQIKRLENGFKFIPDKECVKDDELIIYKK